MLAVLQWAQDPPYCTHSFDSYVTDMRLRLGPHSWRQGKNVNTGPTTKFMIFVIIPKNFIQLFLRFIEYTINHTHLRCTIWSILMYVYPYKIITTIKIRTIYTSKIWIVDDLPESSSACYSHSAWQKAWILLYLWEIWRNSGATSVSNFSKVRECAFNSNTLGNSIYWHSINTKTGGLRQHRRRAICSTSQSSLKHNYLWLQIMMTLSHQGSSNYDRGTLSWKQGNTSYILEKWPFKEVQLGRKVWGLHVSPSGPQPCADGSG